MAVDAWSDVCGTVLLGHLDLRPGRLHCYGWSLPCLVQGEVATLL